MSTSYINGNLVWYDGPAGFYRYASDDEPVDYNDLRPCPKCGKKPLDTGEDACLGHLPGVAAACCGHGGEGYVWFKNGITIRFRGCEVDTWIATP